MYSILLDDFPQGVLNIYLYLMPLSNVSLLAEMRVVIRITTRQSPLPILEAEVYARIGHLKMNILRQNTLFSQTSLGNQCYFPGNAIMPLSIGAESISSSTSNSIGEKVMERDGALSSTGTRRLKAHSHSDLAYVTAQYGMNEFWKHSTPDVFEDVTRAT
ncbi:hypothetical protein BDR04DRAFT_1121516 [Suillus decipiens]|nr:hypothetical protein BDR04DRAFT_1121516 [Suillus decipiens]